MSYRKLRETEKAHSESMQVPQKGLHGFKTTTQIKLFISKKKVTFFFLQRVTLSEIKLIPNMNKELALG